MDKKAVNGFLGILLLTLLIVNYTRLKQYFGTVLEEQIGAWGYFGVFIIVFILEMVPQPLISTLLPYTTGLIFGLKFKLLLPIMLIGAIPASYLSYFIGLRYGENIVGIFIDKKNYDNSVKWFKKNGRIFIATLALTPLPYFPVLGGIFQMKLSGFTRYAIIPRIIHILGYCSILYIIL